MTGPVQRVTRFFAEDLERLQTARMFRRMVRRRLENGAGSSDKTYLAAVRSYWGEYVPVSPESHIFYTSRNGLQDVRYVPQSVFYSVIEPTLNRVDFAAAIDDKANYPELFRGAGQPETVVRAMSGSITDVDFNAISAEEAWSRCCAYDEVVIKPSIGHMGGERIVFLEPGCTTAEHFAEVISRFRGNFVIQAALKQHEVMDSFNRSSVNTVRIMTIRRHDGVDVVSAVLRVGGGAGTRVDNRSSGGIFCGVSETGHTKDSWFDAEFRPIDESDPRRPVNGNEIPFFSQACSMVRKLHERFGHFRLISWDVAMSSSGFPAVIEFNLARQEIDFHQIANGPLFGDSTEAILGEVFQDS